MLNSKIQELTHEQLRPYTCAYTISLQRVDQPVYKSTTFLKTDT